ncbi:putative transcriptional regulatory protein C1F7.11c [Mycena sanguinolenta]|uniref:Putative transcriptional regulatory protein C1F7.11c n=1 Tax=Mycena sanguinolenta TaxID=230812 RepID=A0A8H6YT48_9AGAR|nr:putative transcriptional regulatory protein C1F7.11c [Mycena sanguinolenta]
MRARSRIFKASFRMSCPVALHTHVRLAPCTPVSFLRCDVTSSAEAVRASCAARKSTEKKPFCTLRPGRHRARKTGWKADGKRYARAAGFTSGDGSVFLGRVESCGVEAPVKRSPQLASCAVPKVGPRPPGSAGPAQPPFVNDRAIIDLPIECECDSEAYKQSFSASAMPPSPYERPHPQDSRSAITAFEVDSLPTKTRIPSKASKRIRGEIACAECRRLKIRCDKIVPCSTCVKRGCGSIVSKWSSPRFFLSSELVSWARSVGTIPPGEGSRFVLAATDHLHQKLARMEARRHALEDALAILADKPHPLLSCEYDDDLADEEPGLKLKAVSEEPSQPPQEEEALVDALGSLHIDGEGASRFFGPAGGAEKAKGMEVQLPMSAPFSLRDLDPSYLPPEINQFCNAFPFTPPGIPKHSLQGTIETFLPPIERAIVLCETFLEHLSWMFHIFASPTGRTSLPFSLITLGIGALVDLNLQPYNLEAQHYYRLTQAAVSLQSVMTEPSIVTIKTLHLMSIYNGLSGKESNMEASYGLLDMATQVALRVGICYSGLRACSDPRRPSHTDQHHQMSTRRCGGSRARRHTSDASTFGISWLLYSGRYIVRRPLPRLPLTTDITLNFESNQSIITGRPPTILQIFVDCRIPTEEEEYEFGGNGPPTGLGVWGHEASRECLLPIVRATLGVKPPSYDKIMELDEKIRNFGQPKPLLGDDRTAIAMKNFVRSHYRDMIMIEHATDPMKSPYAHSVFAAYEGACNVLRDTLEQFNKNPLLVTRIWRIWSIAFSAALVIGTLAIRGTNLNLDPPPLERFQVACNMFRGAAETSSRAARALPVLQSMLVKAYHAQQRFEGEKVPAPAPDDEITIFGGRVEAIVRSPPTGSPISPPHKNPPLEPSLRSLRHETLRPPPPAPSPPERLPEMAIPAPPLAQFDMGDYIADMNISHQNWEALFREAGAVYGLQQEYSMDTANMDDRWSSFMHNLDERTMASV